VKKLKEEESEFKKFIGESYNSQITDIKKKEIEAKQRKLGEEKKQLEETRKVMEEEQRRRVQQKLNLKKEREDILQQKELVKKAVKQAEVQGKEEHKVLMTENACKEIEKEEKYKKFFLDYDSMMKMRLQSHVKSVSTIESMKNQQLQDWIKKNEQEYQEKLKEKEQQLRQWRNDNLVKTYGACKSIIDKNMNENTNFRKSYPMRAQENLRLTQANREYQQKLTQEKSEQQKAYNEIFASQMKLKEDINTKYGTMSEHERRMNGKDLNVFKFLVNKQQL